MYTVLYGNLTEGENLEDVGMDGKIVLNEYLKTWDETVWSGLIWLRIGTSGELF
jgi:hypothetical protein